jgi:hypothetical protein
MKAQLTIEFMIILVIMLLLFNAVTLDLVNISTNDTNFMQTAEMVNSSRIMLSDAVSIVSLQGSGAKKTVSIRAPPDCDYMLTSATAISLRCNLGSPSETAGLNGVAVSPISIPQGVIFSINSGIITSGEVGLVTVSKT